MRGIKVKSYEKRDRCHLEVLRIIAIFLVFYNHSAAFKVFETEHGMLYAISLLLSLLCKVSVPIFFMISGALLLGKSEGAKELFQKRILRCVLVLVLFSFCYYMKLFLRGEIELSVIGFLSSILQKEIFLPYWYLYAYMGFLLMLPILRPLAQNLGKGAVCYLIVLGILFRCILPVVQALTGFAVNSNLNISSILGTVFFFPIAGYGIERYVSGKEFSKWKAIVLNSSMVPVIWLNYILAENQYVKSGIHTEGPFGFLVIVPTLLLFFDMKLLVKNEKLSAKTKKLLSFTGDKVFGMYLLEGFLGTGGRMDIIAKTVSELCGGVILAYIIEILCIFIIKLAVVTVMKKMPLLKRIL